jgi:hypothetical protein
MAQELNYMINFEAFTLFSDCIWKRSGVSVLVVDLGVDALYVSIRETSGQLIAEFTLPKDIPVSGNSLSHMGVIPN